MKHIENEVARINYNDSEAMHSSIQRLSGLVKNNSFILEPFRRVDESIKDLFSSEGFQLYPTVKKTTLFFDPETDCFFKILHPLNLKNRVLFHLSDRSEAIYNISEYLFSKGVKIQRVEAYGLFKTGCRPFFAIKKAKGKSLYDMLIRGGKNITMAVYRKVIDETVKLHSLGYWFGDAHLSHIFINGEEVSGIIDIDSIRKNSPFMLKNLAKDLAGLNHPGLPLTRDEKKSLLDYYLNNMDIKSKERFKQQLKHYTERRWKD